MDVRGLRVIAAFWMTMALCALAHGQAPTPEADEETPVAVSAPIR
jgi:hypothetical protein